jgi:hypothetical protein
MLEAKAFRNRDLVLTLNDNVIAVKINADKNRDVAQHYMVHRWPTDVYLYADGSVIERGVSNQDPQAYARTVERVAQRHRDWSLVRVAEREAGEKREQRASANQLPSLKTKIFGEATRKPTPVKVSAATWKEGLVPNPNSSSTQGLAAQSPAPQLPAVQVIDVASHLPPETLPAQVLPLESSSLISPASAPAPSAVANAVPREPPPSEAVGSKSPQERQFEQLASIPDLGGYCPVSLQDFLGLPAADQAKISAWVLGKETFAVRHRGRIYRCASEQHRQRLLQNPDAFTPMLSGCDVVEFARSGSLIGGRCEFGFIEPNTGRVFLFANRENYEEFARQSAQHPLTTPASKERVAEQSHATTVR